MTKTFLIGAVVGTFVGTVSAGCIVSNIQCYEDNSPSRILGNAVFIGAITQEYCAQICADKNEGYTLAGVEFAQQCYCGTALAAGATSKPLSDCNMACSANSAEHCGGNDRISIYNVSCSGTPVPPPPLPPTPRQMVNPCRDPSSPVARYPFCNASLPIETRIADGIARMSVAEKISSLGSNAGAIKELGLNAYNWWSEATHGISHNKFPPDMPYATNFAFPITTGMSFNRSLWRATGLAIGREARAFANAGNAFSTFWAPVINLAREPRWGRNIETPGEDPYLTGEYATQFVQGFERNPRDPTHIQASACCKHYVANSMESTTNNGVRHWRNEFDATVTQQDLIDSYMAPFQACVEKGKVSGLMCSYNAVNGVPSCASEWLLDTAARKEWGFDGYVTSDCDADADVFNNHHYTTTKEEAVAAVLRAGTDIDCGGFVGKNAQSALDKGVITEADLDARLEKAFRVRMRLAHFDPVGPLDSYGAADVCTEETLDTSYDGTAQGSTLLKNDGATLPLKAGTRVAVIGPNAQLASTMAKYYGSSNVCKGAMNTMVDAVAAFAGNTTFALGVPDVKSNDTSGVAAAAAMAAAADDVVMAVGTDLTWAREGSDATSIAFSGGQAALIEAVAAAAKKPITLVLLTATPLDLTAQLANAKIGAILHIGQPSVAVMGAGDVLFGKKAPAGRTIQTVLPAAYQDEVSIFDMNMRPGPSAFPRPDCTKPAAQCPNATNPGRTHRFYTGKAVVPFGFGLSYTTFAYSLAKAPPAAVSAAPVKAMLATTVAAGRTFPARALLDAAAPLVQYEVTVTNTGSVDSDDAVLGFLTPPGAGQNGVPLQSLFGFERVHVKAGASVTVYLYPELTEFAQVGPDGTRAALLGEYTVRFGEARSAKLGQGLVEHKFTLE